MSKYTNRRAFLRDSVLVAAETGHLIGILYRADAEWALGEAEPE